LLKRRLTRLLCLVVLFSLETAPCRAQQAAEADTNDAFESKSYPLLALPRLAWTALVYPLGQLTIYAERTKFPKRILDLFTNASHTFGVLPQVQLGGETGTGGGLRVFHSNIAGKGKQFEGFFVYAGGRGQAGEALYTDPGLAGSRLFWRTGVSYLRTRNRSAGVNGALREDPSRLLQVERLDASMAVGWRLHAGALEPYQRNVRVEGRVGYGRRNLRQRFGPPGPLTDPGSTPRARRLAGLGEEIALYRFGGRIAYDSRDYQAPARTLSHPLNYRLPGRVVTYADGLYHHFRNLFYPERGVLLQAEADYVAGAGDARFFRVAAEAQWFATLFYRNRILALRSRLEKVHRVGGGLIPYPDLPALGGSQQVRGYRRGFFRGEGAWLLSAEYRYPIWDTWNAFLFWDEGQVFDRYGEIGWGAFRASWGGGITLRTETGLLGKLQVGHSAAEKVLMGFTLEQEF
jgi:outer membrane protein assembly factor BamA